MNTNDNLLMAHILTAMGSPPVGLIGSYNKLLTWIENASTYQHLLTDECVKATINIVKETLNEPDYTVRSLRHNMQKVLKRLITALLEVQDLNIYHHPSVILTLTKLETEGVSYYELKATGNIRGDGAPEYALWIGDHVLKAMQARHSHFVTSTQRCSSYVQFTEPDQVIAHHHELIGMFSKNTVATN